jgi:putative heme-binding domain-containing protein
MPMKSLWTFCLLCLSVDCLAQSASPAKPRTKRDYESFAMTHAGDPARGKALFLDARRLACSRCHGTDGKSAMPGPDLFAIGDKFGRRELIESILSPSATIAVGYSTTILHTRDGDVYDGVLKEASATEIALTRIDGEILRIPSPDVIERRTSDLSLMPEGLHACLTLQEFADLVDYLATLKAPESALLTSHGMPATIPQLAHPIALRPCFESALRFEHPVWFGPVPGLSGEFAIVEHETGRIRFANKSSTTSTTFLETGRFDPGTRGFIGMAFHLNYASNRRYFIAKHRNENGHFATYLLEGRATADLRHDSGQPLRQVLKMDATSNVHYGGGLQFGPDGFLYVGMGDTGPQQDPHGNAQNMNLFLGKMLRIDVDHPDGDKPYSIPSDNPFINRPAIRPEIWAPGFREPWRFSFDSLTGDLWVGDVGQDLYEEVDIVRKGENHGWNVYEGFQPFSNKYRRDPEHYTPPLFAYGRKYGVSVTGGYVYRADPKSNFYGVYIFGDYQSARVFGLTQQNGSLKQIRQIAISPEKVVSFGADDRGNLYLVGYEGTIYRIDFQPAVFE